MRRVFLYSLTFLSLLLSSCSTSTPQTPLQVVSVYSSSSAQPWLMDVYECAETFAIISRVDDPSSADVVLRIGEPKYLTSYAYQIDEEEILIVTHRLSPVQNLTLAEVQVLFAGLGDPSVQVWVYASEEDVFGVFDQFVMEGRSVSSSARVAVNPQQMSDVLNVESNTVGILPRHWKAGDIREVYSVGKVPVLAVTQSEPQGVVNQLIDCLQK
ncbi:MAG TPA: hypothetical protein VLT51_01240 [Anaerolineales bacterium]|nr:hypothetical protein [Anaerolineales bacterium]